MKNINYADNMGFNIHASLTDHNFQQKLVALRTLETQMTRQNVTWAVYSSAAMFLLGITPDFNDWDLITIPNDIETTFSIFANLNATKYEPPAEKSRYFDPPCRTYSLRNTNFDVSKEFTITTFGTEYIYKLNKEDIEYIDVEWFQIPICPAEAMFIIYYMMTGWQPNREIKVRWLHDYLENNLRHPNILQDALAQNIPYWIKAEVKELLANNQ